MVATDDTIMPMLSTGRKRQCAHVGVCRATTAHPYNVFDFTLSRGRDGPKYFLKDYNQVLLADAYGGYNGVVAGNGSRAPDAGRICAGRFIDAEKAAPEIAREAIEMVRSALRGREAGEGCLCRESGSRLRQEQSAPVLAQLREKLLRLEGAVAAQASHGRGGAIRPGPVGRN